MKKVGILLLQLSLCAYAIKAQGIYQMWGTFEEGGEYHIGTLYSMNEKGENFKDRYDFKPIYPGETPFGELKEFNGKYYGTTTNGGRNRRGVIFEWDPATNNYTTKFDFTKESGSGPQKSLTLCLGKFYGTTTTGPKGNAGCLFEWDPVTNVYTKKIDFDFINASASREEMVEYNGKVYGTTSSSYDSYIFEYDPATNVFSKKFNLRQAFQGAGGHLTIKDGIFYGTTNPGGLYNKGVLFAWNLLSNSGIKILDLNENTGYLSTGSFTFKNGKFYGLMSQGGYLDGGVLFEWDPVTRIYNKRYEFQSATGSSPDGTLREYKNKFYATASHGGNNKEGVLFEWDPATNVYTKKLDFDGMATFSRFNALTLAGDKFYALALSGGGNLEGAIYEWYPVTNLYTRKIDFNRSEGDRPMGTLTFHNWKLYGVAYNGGNARAGVIFEWDILNKKYTSKVYLNKNDGGYPQAGLAYSNGKFYGAQGQGINNMGVIFEWDPVTNIYAKKFDMDTASGGRSTGSLVLHKGKFYGTTGEGGAFGSGTIFEWDPVSDVYTKKIDFSSINGGVPKGTMLMHNEKFYGVARFGGTYGWGVLFEWDPATNVYIKKWDFKNDKESLPIGSLIVKENKLYGLMDPRRILNNPGKIFEFDLSTNTYTDKAYFNGSNGSLPSGALLLSRDKKSFYGITRLGGIYDNGVVFMWNPETNAISTKKDFNGIGYQARYGNDHLSYAPAPVADGVADNCLSLATVTIDNTNKNDWVSIVDEEGHAVAEINANGNVLGVVNASVFINNKEIREDDLKRLYLDRSITLSPQFQPTTPVDIRLYVKNAEYIRLKNSVNSDGTASGINSVEDVAIYKGGSNCEAKIPVNAQRINTGYEPWVTEHVFTASVNSLSSFYFASKAVITIPVKILEFTGRLENNDAVLDWKTDYGPYISHFEIERSIDSIHYAAIGNVVSIKEMGIKQYGFTDPAITSLGVPNVYYRLKLVDANNRIIYSDVVVINIDYKEALAFYPNPVLDDAGLYITSSTPERFDIRIIDNLGRLLKYQVWNISPGNSSLLIDLRHLPGGVYYLDLKGKKIDRQFKFLKL